MVKKSNLPQSLILLSGLAGIGFLFIQNRKVISEGVGKFITRRPTPQAFGDIDKEPPLRQEPFTPKDIRTTMIDDRRRKTPRPMFQLPTEPARRQPTRTEERRTETGRVTRETRKVKRLGEVVRKPRFLSAKERASREATTRKFGLTRRPSAKEGRKRVSGRATKLALFEEQEKARKIFDARGITNF